jgi:hypothetical protein
MTLSLCISESFEIEYWSNHVNTSSLCSILFSYQSQLLWKSLAQQTCRHYTFAALLAISGEFIDLECARLNCRHFELSALKYASAERLEV